MLGVTSLPLFLATRGIFMTGRDLAFIGLGMSIVTAIFTLAFAFK